MDYAGRLPTIKIGKGISQPDVSKGIVGAGGYLEDRIGVYTSEIYAGKRFIHMGVDIWAPAGYPVYAFADGTVHGFRDNANPLDYGPTLVTEHDISGQKIWALYGHISRESLEALDTGMPIKKGQTLAVLGTEEENGGWVPHLHFQVSVREPAGPDMPGVVSPDELPEAIRIYPDPRIVLGPIYI